jgi:tRNA-Thr(GGU) m(6)t(6)A37 methyltransferase TsaA
MKYEITPIGVARTPFKEKFAIPRQPGLAPSIKSYIEFFAPFDNVDCFDGIEQHSHLWIEFLFHENLPNGWSTKVRPPRLGGNKKLGVFATRSSFRPNGLGLSVGKLIDVERLAGRAKLVMQGLDLLDGTPIIDIKPYIPYADCVIDAQSSFAADKPNTLKVCFSEQAEFQCTYLSNQHPELRQVLLEILAQDPRPAYQKMNNSDRIYGVRLFDLEIKWTVQNSELTVVSITQNDAAEIWKKPR